ncbi:hypothetical protein ACET3X_002300 [Alternaria dauci]|uniref:MYND-type domain-containing protein n=1 Tax=Alternaria dauci TaxID=48095 RepID=A0ABR3UP95_9PLEO
MSLKPAHITQGPYFYPVGNTPAVCLTQALPPEQDAALLLLGCGDIRSILFTAYSGAGSDNRKLDFTCCDIEAEIIARNILALTLILDDISGTRSASLLQSQSKKLVKLAQSLKSSDEGPYSTIIRFCDSVTLKNTVKLWKLYALEPGQDQTYDETQTMLKAQWKDAKDLQAKTTTGTGFTGNGTRAIAPQLAQGIQDLDKFHRTYWNSGTCLEDNKAIKNLSTVNPMFVCNCSGLILHYSTNSPLLVPNDSTKGKVSNAIQASLAQLSAWCVAFRKASTRVTLRHVNSEAVALCHVLQHQRAYGESHTAHWYRSTWTYTPLVLDATDYEQGGPTPLIFDVVDTSSLLNHVGCLNILAATASLIRQSTSSVLQMEMLLPSEIDIAASAKALLCGHLPTVALLLGLRPVQYWANATTSFPGLAENDTFCAAASRPIVLWKTFDTSSIHYDAAELARLVLSVYLSMFEHESWTYNFSMLDLGYRERKKRRLGAYQLYSRAGFVSLLQHTKVSDVVDWSPFMQALIKEGILNDITLDMGPYNFHSLLVHLDMLSLWKVEDSLEWWYPRTFELGDSFRSWKGIPAVMCVTLIVPHNKVSMFGDLGKGHGTPLCHIQLTPSVSMKEAIYADIQLGFGTIEASGTAFTNEYRLTVREDEKGWEGGSPLIVSTMVSTCSLVKYEDAACGVAFALKSTPMAVHQLMPQFSMLSCVHESAVGQEDVFVSQHRPGFKGFISVNENAAPQQNLATDVVATIHPVIKRGSNDIGSLRVHYTIYPGQAQQILQTGGSVEFEMPTAFTLRLIIGKRYRKDLLLPFPLDASSAKTKIARKLLWIRHTATVEGAQALFMRPDNLLPVRFGEQSGVSLEQLHYIQPDVLPKIHLGQHASYFRWISAHTSPLTTLSTSEFRAYNKFRADEASTMPARLGVKGCLQTIFALLVGAEGRGQARIFQFCTATSYFGILYVDSVRMDVSNQSIFADAAFIPCHLSTENGPLPAVLAKRNDNMARFRMKDDEVKFWKHILPGLAERCRQWQQKSTCEYKTPGCIPISTDHDQRYMCTCGVGIFPVNYLQDLKPSKEFFKHAVRVAVPVIFASPINTDNPGSVVPPPPSAMPSSVPEAAKPAPIPRLKPRLVELGQKQRTCWECGVKRSKDGSMLSKCASCKVAQYCSADCQNRNWRREHKQLCTRLQEG